MPRLEVSPPLAAPSHRAALGPSSRGDRSNLIWLDMNTVLEKAGD